MGYTAIWIFGWQLSAFDGKELGRRAEKVGEGEVCGDGGGGGLLSDEKENDL